MGRAARALAAAGMVLAVAVPAAAIPPPGAPVCHVFPSNNVWHADVSKLPVNARSAAWLASMSASSTNLHPDFGPSGTSMPYGIPYDVVPDSHPKVKIAFQYADESDPGPYPFGSDTKIEGGSDRHAIMVDSGTCVLYELFDAHYSANGSIAGSGAVFNLGSNKLRPATWTSADAAGLPIFAGLVRLDEVKAGNVDHAIRMTAQQTDKLFIWPARHQAGSASNHNLPPMGARFRLKASFDISHFRADTQTILRAMKKYGLIVADNGSNWYFQGTAEDGWSTAMLDQLKTVPARAFEAVDESSLMISPDSGAVRTTSAVSSSTPVSKPKSKPIVSVSARATATASPKASPSRSPSEPSPSASAVVVVAAASDRAHRGVGGIPVVVSLICLLIVIAAGVVSVRIRNRTSDRNAQPPPGE